jgi:hypothetical protein
MIGVLICTKSLGKPVAFKQFESVFVAMDYAKAETTKRRYSVTFNTVSNKILQLYIGKENTAEVYDIPIQVTLQEIFGNYTELV